MSCQVSKETWIPSDSNDPGGEGCQGPGTLEIALENPLWREIWFCPWPLGRRSIATWIRFFHLIYQINQSEPALTSYWPSNTLGQRISFPRQISDSYSDYRPVKDHNKWTPLPKLKQDPYLWFPRSHSPNLEPAVTRSPSSTKCLRPLTQTTSL